MVFLEAFGVGFAITLGVEVALGLCMAISRVTRGMKK